MKNENAIKNFWAKNCRTLPLTRFAKIGDHVRENEHLVFEVDSVDMWTQIKLFMVQGKYNIDAVMDLKIDKNLELREFRNLMQKLAL